MSNKKAPLNYIELSHLLSQLQFPMRASEIHGLITGLTVGEEQRDKRMALLYELTNEGESFTHALREAILTVFDETTQGLQSEELSFEVLIPDETQSVFDRIDALAEWVNHFLLGLGVTRVDIATLDDEAKEMFFDLREIAKLGYDLEEDEKTLESDFESVKEYVKVAVLNYYDKFNSKPNDTKQKMPNLSVSNETLEAPKNQTLH